MTTKTKEPKSKAITVEPTRSISQAFTYGDMMFSGGDDIPQPLRSTMARELKSLQRGGSGISDDALAQAVKLSVPSMACINYAGSNAASIPIVVKKSDVVDHHPFDFFLSQYRELIEDGIKSFAMFGKIYYQKIYNEHETLHNPRGFPTGLKYINPNNITQMVDRETKVITGYKLHLENNREASVNEIIYISDFAPSGDGNPLSKLENAFVHLGVEQGVASHAMSLFLNGALPVGIVSFDPPINNKDYEKAKQQWRKEYQGSKNAYKTGFTNGSIKWTPITQPPKDLAMGELTDNSKQMIAAAFSTPPELVGLSDSSGNSLSVEQTTALRKGYLEGFLIPLVGKVLDALNRQWLWVDFGPRGFYNLATNERAMQIFSQVTLDRVAMTNQLVKGGTIDYAQQLELLDLPPMEVDEDMIVLSRPPAFAIALWKVGLVSMNMALNMVGLEPNQSGDIYNVSGSNIQVPEEGLGKVYAKPSYLPYSNPGVTIQQAAELASGAGIETPDAPPPETNPVDELPAETVAGAVEEIGTAPNRALGDGGDCIMGFISDTGNIKRIQDTLRGFIGDDATWEEPDNFHVTMVYTNKPMPEKMRNNIPLDVVMAFPIAIDGIGVFDTPDGYAVHLTVRQGGMLSHVQEVMWDSMGTFRDSVEPSEFSAPGNYTPHITLCYSKQPFDTPPPLTPFSTMIDSIQLNDNNHEVVRELALRTTSTANRSTTSIDIAINFAGHAFVSMAKRQLAKQLEGVDVDWIDSDDWQLPLIKYSNCVDNNVTAMMNNIDIDSHNIELQSTGYRLHNGAIYFTLEPSKDLSILRSSLRVRLENNVGMVGDVAPVTGIKLCNCGDAEITDEMLGDDVIAAPLVVDSVSVYINNAIANVWRIQHSTQEQRSELSQWRSKYKSSAKRGIAEVDVEFDVEQLPQNIVEYIQENITPGCDVSAVFSEARRRLAIRAIQSTLVDFEIFMEDTIAAARDGSLPRPRFTRQLRNAINRYGAAGYRDGLVDGGVLDASMTDDDKIIADEMIADNQKFAKELSARIYSKDGISDEEAATRPGVWGRSVVMPLYNSGRLSADRNGMYELVQASTTVDKCPDCKRLLGQVHRFKDWAKRGLLMPNPGEQKTECEGWECGHTQVKVDSRANGSY